MARNSTRKKLPLHKWQRYDFAQPAPEHECVNCHFKGHCYKWEMYREVNAFGNLIRQTRQIIECKHCLNEFVVGSMDLPIGKNTKSKKPRKFKLRKLSKEERAALMAVVEQEVKFRHG